MSVTLKHDGLPPDVTKIHLWELFKAIAPARYKLTFRETRYVELAIKTCGEVDYLPGAICAFWMRVSKIAKALDCTPRQVNSIETSLEKKGLICRTMGRNGLRYATRKTPDKNSPVTMAAGINLAPLIKQYRSWVKIKEAQDLLDEACAATRAEIQNKRRRIHASKHADMIAQAEAILPRGRTSKISDFGRLEAILAALEALLETIEDTTGNGKTSDGCAEISDASEVCDAPKIQTHSSDNSCSGLPGKRPNPNLPTKRQVMLLASVNYRSRVGILGGPTDANIVEASRQLAQDHGVSPKVWRDACEQFGRHRAALCVLAIDRAMHLPVGNEYHRKKLGGSLVGMIQKDRATGFNLNGLLWAMQGYPVGVEGEIALAVQSSPSPFLPGAKQVGDLTAHIFANITIDEPEDEP